MKRGSLGAPFFVGVCISRLLRDGIGCCLGAEVVVYAGIELVEGLQNRVGGGVFEAVGGPGAVLVGVQVVDQDEQFVAQLFEFRLGVFVFGGGCGDAGLHGLVVFWVFGYPLAHGFVQVGAVAHVHGLQVQLGLGGVLLAILQNGVGRDAELAPEHFIAGDGFFGGNQR